MDPGLFDRAVDRIVRQASDEPAVDLELAELQALQAAERGETDAEIVHGQMHAERMQSIRMLQRAARGAHGDVFGNLHLQTIGGQDRRDQVDEA
nr:hypothetical protein [Verticiella sediminum]